MTALLGCGADEPLEPSQIAVRRGGESETDSVVPPEAKTFGRTSAQWSARWWQWALAIPNPQSPLLQEDLDCQLTEDSESGPVWFLSSVPTMSARSCVIPASKALFFPVVNAECSTLESAPFHGDTDSELKACSETFTFSDLHAAVDEEPIEALATFRVVSPPFKFEVPADNFLGVPGPDKGRAVSNGVYVLIESLSKGSHTLTFSGTVQGGIPPVPPTTFGGSYILTVE